jgi:response regulator RpfG family c-di-GMP phosphodiesterase
VVGVHPFAGGPPFSFGTHNLGRYPCHSRPRRGFTVGWADDHPEYNTAIAELLRQFGASVETPRSNAAALALLRASRYDVVISDVARDDEGPDSNLKG